MMWYFNQKWRMDVVGLPGQTQLHLHLTNIIIHLVNDLGERNLLLLFLAFFDIRTVITGYDYCVSTSTDY